MSKSLTWNLKLLYKGDDDPKMKKDVEEAARNVHSFVKKWKPRKDYLKDPKILKEALDEYESLSAHYGLAGNADYYWWLRSAQDEDNTDIKAEVNKLHEVAVKLQNELEFFDLRVAKIEAGLQPKFLKFSGLKPYKHHLELLFENSKYQLTEAEEKIVNLKSKTSHSNWVDMTSRFISREERIVQDEDGRKRKKNFSELLDLVSSQKKRVRDGAAAEIHDINRKYADVAEAEMNSIMENKKFEDELRGFERPDSARHVADDVDSSVVDAMLEAVSSKFSVPKRYYKLKSQLMGIEKLGYHERDVPLGVIPGEYSFEKGVKLVEDVFRGLDPEFAEILKHFLENGHFDVFPRKGKSGGAFCAKYLKISPVYILLNHTNRVNDVLTIAHEVGHGINDEMMRKSQNALNYSSPLSIAEVASTFFEDFVLTRLMEDASDKIRLMLMMEKLNDEMRSIFRQTAAYMFEQELHREFRERGYLSKDEIGKIFKRHMRAYMGTSVSQDPGAENWWVYWGHFRRFFYVYSYSSGLLISKSLQSMIREEPRDVEKVKRILSAGRSASPVEIFKSVGLDIKDKNFWDRGLAETEQLLKDTEKLARKLGKM